MLVWIIWEAKESTGARSCFQISVAVWQHLWRPCSPNPAHGRSPAAGCPVTNNDALSCLSALWGSPVQKRCGHAGVSLAAPPWWLGGRGGSAWGRGEHRGALTAVCSHPIAVPRDGARPFPEVLGAGRKAAHTDRKTQRTPTRCRGGEGNYCKSSQIPEGAQRGCGVSILSNLIWFRAASGSWTWMSSRGPFWLTLFHDHDFMILWFCNFNWHLYCIMYCFEGSFH